MFITVCDRVIYVACF